jgi:hypothetical protein
MLVLLIHGQFSRLENTLLLNHMENNLCYNKFTILYFIEMCWFSLDNTKHKKYLCI